MENLHPDDVLRNLSKKAKDKEKWRKVNYARYAMYVISALLILSATFTWYTFSSNDLLETGMGADIVLYVMFAFAAIYIGLSIWAKSQPKYALSIAIAVFILPQIFEALGNPSAISNGLWWKILILGLFIRGLLSVKHINSKTVDEELLDDF